MACKCKTSFCQKTKFKINFLIILTARNACETLEINIRYFRYDIRFCDVFGSQAVQIPPRCVLNILW